MRILLLGNKERGILCLKKIINNHEVVGVVGNKKESASNYFIDEARKLGFNVLQPTDINDTNFLDKVRALKPEIAVLAGYSQIIKKEFILIPEYGCINLHGGKLPKYRGSSPLNWAIINGEKSFSLTIIKINEGVDTGNILLEKMFPIRDSDTIVDLLKVANVNFPNMLEKVLNQLKKRKIKPIVQNNKASSYYPLRFPIDGLVFFDQLNSEEIHNRVRALTSPYPGVLCFYKKRKVKILKSSLTKEQFYGEPGRIYRISKKRGLLVCAKDKCLWLEQIVDNKTGISIMDNFKRYDVLGTIKELAIEYYDNQ